MPWLIRLTAVASTLLFAACGGGGGSGGGPFTAGVGNPVGTGSTAGSSFIPGVFQPSSNFRALCATPRTGINPATGNPFTDSQGTFVDENNWLRSWSHELYLWYDEILDVNPTTLATPQYFDQMQTFATTASGAPKDKFHFTYDTEQYQALVQSGTSAGYGATLTFLSRSVPRQVVVAYTEPDSPATAAGVNLIRGTEILGVDGVSVVNGSSSSDLAVLNAALFPSDTGQSHQFEVRDPGAASSRFVTMVSATITSQPVQHVQLIDVDGDPVGYMLFNDHIVPAEAGLVNAISQLEDAGVTDLFLDLRYNGGGYLTIANELAFMIAGPALAQGRTFDELQFNSKHQTFNPVTGARLSPTLFRTTAAGFSVPSGTPLPSLNLSRVFILAGPDTCSASEAVINGLLGIGIEVILIGDTTCGKPYGFYGFDNCGTTYFSIHFRGVNAAGYGDFSDGFTPTQSVPLDQSYVPGCLVEDDFSRPLGDVQEARLAAAIQFRTDGTCPDSSASASGRSLFATPPLSGFDVYTPKPFWLQNRIMEPN